MESITLERPRPLWISSLTQFKIISKVFTMVTFSTVLSWSVKCGDYEFGIRFKRFSKRITQPRNHNRLKLAIIGNLMKTRQFKCNCTKSFTFPKLPLPSTIKKWKSVARMTSLRLMLCGISRCICVWSFGFWTTDAFCCKTIHTIIKARRKKDANARVWA